MSPARWVLIVALLAITGISFANDSTPVIERPDFIYHIDNPLYVSLADSALPSARQRLITILGDSLDYRPDVYVLNNMAKFKELVGTGFPDWGAAAALPYRHLVAIKSPAHFYVGHSLRELLQHEYSHLALAHRLHFAEPPRWLDEGLAMWVSSEWGWSQNVSMTRAVVFNSIVPLKEISRLNLFPEGKAQTAYSESYLAVKYLLDSYGTETFNMFLDTLRAGRPVDMSLSAATGSGYNAFEKEFFEYLRQRYNLMTFLGDTYYIWVALALVVVIGFILGYMKKRRYYKKWDEEDRYESRDFDYGDTENPEQEDDEDKPWA